MPDGDQDRDCKTNRVENSNNEEEHSNLEERSRKK